MKRILLSLTLVLALCLSLSATVFADQSALVWDNAQLLSQTTEDELTERIEMLESEIGYMQTDEYIERTACSTRVLASVQVVLPSTMSEKSSRTSSNVPCANICGFEKRIKNAGVCIFTLLSVHCAERITATIN